MRTLWIHLLTLVAVYSARNIPKRPSFPDDLYPANVSRTEFKSKCSRHSSKIGYCAPLYRECILKLSSVKDCGIEFCSCVKISDKDENEPTECYDHFACGAVHTNGNLYKKLIMEDETHQAMKKITKTLKPLLDAQNNLTKECDIESKLKVEEEQMRVRMVSINALLELTLPFFSLANIELSKTERCEKARSHYLDTLEDVCGKTSPTLKIPYNMWFVGAEFGPIGRVATMIAADETCDKSSSEFNHHSVVRVTCYDQQREKDKCDEDFSKSANYILSTLDSKKVQCKMFVEYVERIQRLRSDVFYREAAEYHADASKVFLNERFLTKGFKADNQSLTQRDTKTTIISFESTELFSPRLQQNFGKVSSECSNSRNIVASCGFRYGQCILERREQCQKKLKVCLSEIPEMSKSCEEAYQNASYDLWPSTPPTQEPKVVPPIQPIESSSYWGIWRTGIIICGAVVFAALICFLVMKAPSCSKLTERKFSGNEDHSTNVEKPLLGSAPSSETSLSGSGTITPSPRSDGTHPSETGSNETLGPENNQIQPDSNHNNSNVPLVEEEILNNIEPDPSTMKSDTDSVSHFPILPNTSV